MGFSLGAIIASSTGAGSSDSGGGAGFSYKERLRVRSTTSSVATVSFNHLALRGFDRVADASPVVPNNSVEVFSNETRSISTATTGLGGFLSAPVNDTLYRILAFGYSGVGVACLAVPYTSDDWTDDIPNSEDIDSNYSFIREVGELYVDSSGNILNFTRDNDRVTFASPIAVFTSSSISSPAVSLLPDELPEGLTGLEVYAVGGAGTSGDVASAFANATDQYYMQFQSDNIGFEAYVTAPTSLQGDRPKMMHWDGLLFIYSKSTKSGEASTGTQSCLVNGYERPV